MGNITDQELLSQYVLLSKEEYMASVKALQSLDIINDILDRGDKYRIPDMIRLVLGKEVKNDD